MTSNPYIYIRVAHITVALENWLIILLSWSRIWSNEYEVCGHTFQMPRRLAIDPVYRWLALVRGVSQTV